MSTIYFVTNRDPNRKKNPDDFGSSISSQDIHDLRFGRATIVKQDGKLKVAAVEVAPERLKEDPEKSLLGSDALFLELRTAMKKGIDTLAFIHGYNVSFRGALETGGRLLEAYGAHRPLNVVVFSWPSDGSLAPLLAYKSDRADARASGPALARLILRTRDLLLRIRRGDECDSRMHLMAHSMGNYVLRHGLQELRRLAGSDLPTPFDQVFLMAADEDHDAFEHDHKLAPLPELGAGVNVYFNKGDTVLVGSDFTKNNPARLGARGPRLPLNVPGNVINVDVSPIVGGVGEHWYYSGHARTIADAAAVMDGTPHDQIPLRRYDPAQNRYVLEPDGS